MGRRARWRRWRRTVPGLLGALALPLAAQQPPNNPYDAPTDAGISQSVARISYLNGNVSFARGDDPDQWQDADLNVPMTIGDRVYTGDGSLELQLEHGALVDLDARTDLATLNLTDQVSQIAVKSGVASFAVPRLEPGEVFEVDTPNAAVTLDQPGRYRVDVDENGQTRVVVRRGNATVAAGGGQLVVGDGEGIMITGTDAPRYEVVATPPPDRWDTWAGNRQDRELRAVSARYVSPSVVGAGDLDGYGQWNEIPNYGRVWSPASVGPGWAPYQQGRWTWQDPWGWTWISTEAWGWAPYHYGRWVNYSARWYWVPVAPTVSVSYAPALVAFVGGSVGVGVVASPASAYVGWFPLGPRDPLNPWWGPRAQVNVTQVTNVTYVNRTYVTVVNQNTFVSGSLVAPAVVRETTVVRQVAAAPVVVGHVAVLPTAASTRATVRAAAAPAPRPPAAVASRTVVTRSAPPPAPPRFEQKLAAIRENRAPVAPAAAARLAPSAAAVVPVRSVAAEAGNVRLAPAQPNAARQKQVEPVTQAARVPASRAPQPPAAARPAQDAEAPARQPTAPAVQGRRPDEPALAAPRAGAPPPGAPRPNERPESAPAQEREVVRPTPRPMSPTPPDWRARQGAPPAPAAQRESGEAPPRGSLRPTPSYLNPNRPTPPRANPEREAAPPQRENPQAREAAPARPAPPRAATPAREETREGSPERGTQAHPQSETQQGHPTAPSNRGRRPTPRPTPRPD